MHLYVMRHGPSEGDSPTGRDFDRRLTPSGAATVEAMAKELASRGEAVSQVISSPLVRAVQTAEIVRRVLGVESDIEIREELAPSEGSLDLVYELSKSEVSALIVSHAPDVSDLVAMLTERRAGSFSAGMIVAVDVSGRIASVRFVIDPARV
jgi:phosphohistidine phosphatase